MAKKKSSSKALSASDLSTQLAEYASKDGSKIKVAESSMISIKGKKFSYQGGVIGTDMPVVVLGFVRENRFYGEDWDEDNPVPPICFSFEDEDGAFIPHEDSFEAQCGSCDECPNDEWGSAEKGAGKACGNRIRLLVIDADIGEDMDEWEHMRTAEVAMINAPATSINNWNKYVKDLQNKYNMPPFGVVTNLSFDEDEDFPVLLFEVEREYSPKDKEDAMTLTALLERRASEESALVEPYDSSNYDPDANKKAKKSNKKPAKKRGKR
jgi:hypothetical protein